MISEESRRLLELFLRLNRRLESITKTLRPDLPVTLSYFLTEVAQRPGISLTEAAAALRVEKSGLSRLSADAVKRGLLVTKTSGTDARRLELSVTPAGERSLGKDMELRNLQVRECIARLPESKWPQLASDFGVIADALGSDRISPLPGELPVRCQIRRLTQVMGLLGSDFLGTGLSVEDVQILTALAHHGHAVGLAQITAHLPYSQSAVSRLADSLIKQGLMAKTVDPADRRRFFVHLTLEGKRCINTALDTASRALEPACVALGKRYARLEEALMRFLPEATVAAKESSVTVHHVESDAERRLARAFLMEELVRTQRHLDASETLISRENTVLTLNSDENIVGVLEVSKRGHRYYVENFALAAQHPTSGTLMLLLDGLRTLDRPAHGARSIVVKKTIADEFPDLLSLGASSPDEPHTWEIPFPARTH